MIRNMRIPLLLVLAIALLALAACGRSESDDSNEFGESAAPAAAFDSAASIEREVVKDVARGTSPGAAIAPQAAAMATAAPAAMAPPRAPAPRATDESPGSAGQGDSDVSVTEEQVAEMVVQRRIIVRTVDIRTVVTDVAASIDSTAELAGEMGGWVVSSNRSEKHRGFISIRVPADRLDESVLRLRESAVEVESEISTSRDVTDEYVDTQSRLTNLQATEQALLSMMERAEKVEEALKVQESLSRFQEEIERLLGRIKFLEQTSAFSLLNLVLVLDAAEMPTDAGEDQTAGVGELVRFRAFFKPAEGIENFTYTWDFGDGTSIVHSSRTAPTEDEDTRVTATVTHVYSDERDSPYIAQLEITGSGDAGLAEGEDTVIVTVTKVPTIEIFAGERTTVEEGLVVELNGSFTRPEGVKEVKYRWTFGDGSTPAEGDLDGGVTNAVATHIYPNHRPFPYTATLTITAESEAGAVENSGSVSVRVTEAEGWVIGGWSAGEQFKTAVRSLSAVAQWSVTSVIWLVLFSPVWIAVVIAVVVIRRRSRGRADTAGGGGSGDTTQP
jgi:hypothetical protein